MCVYKAIYGAIVKAKLWLVNNAAALTCSVEATALSSARITLRHRQHTIKGGEPVCKCMG